MTLSFFALLLNHAKGVLFFFHLDDLKDGRSASVVCQLDRRVDVNTMFKHHLENIQMPLLDRMVEDCTTCVVLLQRACSLLKQVADNLREAATTSVN